MPVLRENQSWTGRHHSGAHFCVLTTSTKHPDPDGNLMKINSMMREMFQFSYDTIEPFDGCM